MQNYPAFDLFVAARELSIKILRLDTNSALPNARHSAMLRSVRSARGSSHWQRSISPVRRCGLKTRRFEP
jgi:hypothetical protein